MNLKEMDRFAYIGSMIITLIYFTTYYYYTNRLNSEIFYRLIFRSANNVLAIIYDYWTFTGISIILWIFSWYVYVTYGIYL